MRETINVNKTIHEAMGLCWHEAKKQTGRPEHQVLGGPIRCKKCGSRCSNTPCENLSRGWNPDYTTHGHYCKLMDWMCSSDLLGDFNQWLLNTHGILDWIRVPRQEQINLIAEAIEAGVLK